MSDWVPEPYQLSVLLVIMQFILSGLLSDYDSFRLDFGLIDRFDKEFRFVDATGVSKVSLNH